MLCLFAMERPVSLDGEDVRNEKTKLLRMCKQLDLNDVVLGQYAAQGKLPGYTDDETVPSDR